MKKTVISGMIVVLVIAGIGMSYMLFRGRMRTEKEQKSYEENNKRVENLMKPGQEGEGALDPEREGRAHYLPAAPERL